MTADSVRGQSGRTPTTPSGWPGVEASCLLRGIRHRGERSGDGVAQCGLVRRGNIHAGGCDDFRLIDGDIGHCKAIDYFSIAGDIACGLGLVVVRPRRHGFLLL